MHLLRVALPVAALIVASPAFAQPSAPAHDEHHPSTAAPAASADQAAMHEKCKAMMGARMDPKHPHEHSADKQGITGHARGVPPTKAEMEKMHKQCAEMMAKAEAAKK